MKIKMELSFDLGDESERDEYECLMKAEDMRSLLWELDGELRKMSKYPVEGNYRYRGEGVSDRVELADAVRKHIWELGDLYR
jgi:hypothetical protein